MTQHTPGPWHVETVLQDDAVASIAIREGAYGLFIAMAESHEMAYADAEANARLIAAAPELLAALQVAESMLGGHATGREILTGSKAQQIALEGIRAAIAKATA